MCESCWLLPLPLVPLLKLLTRDRALSEAEVGRPLEGENRSSAALWEGAPLRRPRPSPPAPRACRDTISQSPGPSPGGQQLGTGMSQDVPSLSLQPQAAAPCQSSRSRTPDPNPTQRSAGAGGAQEPLVRSAGRPRESRPSYCGRGTPKNLTLRGRGPSCLRVARGWGPRGSQTKLAQQGGMERINLGLFSCR